MYTKKEEGMLEKYCYKVYIYIYIYIYVNLCAYLICLICNVMFSKTSQLYILLNIKCSQQLLVPGKFNLNLFFHI